jgi:hypothetical protein
VFARCYAHLPFGVVIEKDRRKATRLAMTRPTWAVYEADSECALTAGVAGVWPVSFLDCDPYGSPWEVLEAFFQSERERSDRLAVAVNDGLRQKLRLGGGWNVHCLREMVERYGNERMHDEYTEVCREMLANMAAVQGYAITHWTAYYCGASDQMTHYGAVLER